MRAALLVAAALTAFGAVAPPSIDVLMAVGSLPPPILSQFRDPAAFVQTDDGRYLVFDRRAQAVFDIDSAKRTVRKAIAIGPSDGEILRPLSFAFSSVRTMVILDNPGDYERVQTFHDTGTPLSVFRHFPAASDALRLNADAMLSSGLSELGTIGANILAQAPDGQSLFSEYTPQGAMTRRIGRLRPTGYERDRQLHQALNAGIALAAPDGTLNFVFTTGVPMFRKYTATGELVFERHIEGPELDAVVQALPQTWPTRRVNGLEFPIVTTTVSTAAIDASGRLWIALSTPFTYVYDATGNKIRTVQFRGADMLVPWSLFFSKAGHILVAPGCYEFDANPR